MIKPRSLFSCMFLLFGLSLVAACSDTTAVYPDQPEVAATPETQSYPGLAPLAPPKPRYEQPPPLESSRGAIWRPGYWSWTGSDFTWVPGEVIPRPDPTAIWFPDHWIRHTYGWAFVPGYWE